MSLIGAGWLQISGNANSSGVTAGSGLTLNGTTMSVSQSDPSNMLGNPGFENLPSLSAWSQFDGTWITQNSVVYAGKLAAAFVGGPAGLLGQTFQTNATVPYQFSAWARSSAGATGTVYVVMAFLDLNGSGLATTFTPIPAGTTWTEYTVLGTGPTGTAFIQVYLQVDSGATGTWYFDNAILVPEPLSGGLGINVVDQTMAIALDDPSNMLFNAGFEQLPAMAQWSQTVPGAYTIESSVVFQGGFAAETGTSSAQLYQQIPCQPGDQFVLTCYAASTAGATGAPAVEIWWMTAANAFISYVGANITAGTAWNQYTVSGTAPSNAAFIRAIVFYTGSGVTGTWYVDSCALRRMALGNNIALGVVDNSHIVAGQNLIIITTGLPTLPNGSYPSGIAIFNVSDGYIYKNVANAWKNIQDPAGMIAGTLAAGVVISGAGIFGTLNAGVVVSGSSITGTLTAVTVSASTFTGSTMTLTKNGITTYLDNGTSPFVYSLKSVDGSGNYALVNPGVIEIESASGASAVMQDNTVTITSAAGIVITLSALTGFISIANGANSITLTDTGISIGSSSGYTGPVAGRSAVGGIVV
jgi:hypothetical protein